MGVRHGQIVAFGIIALAGPAGAQGLINGEALQYNYSYRCNGERIIVARCRDGSDSSYCQVVYPDRPYQNGMQVAPVEQRGTIVAKLDACMRPKATSVATGSSPTAIKARSPVTAPQAAGAPGLGKATWSMLDADEDSAIYFSAAKIKRASGSGSGWFTSVYSEPKEFPGTDVKGAIYSQARYDANCAKRLLRMTDIAVYDRDGKQLAAGAMPNPSWDPVEPDSTGADKLNILCGKSQPLAVKSPVIGDHGDLMAEYMKFLEKEMDAAHDAQMKGGRKAH